MNMYIIRIFFLSLKQQREEKINITDAAEIKI